METPLKYKIDISGMKFGKWTVKSFDDSGKKLPHWNCVCECGTKRSVWAADLKRGRSTNCGCEKNKRWSESLTTHNMSRHPAYRSWTYMRSRCGNPNDDGYALYGGRGITVCQQWETFPQFWKDMGETWAVGLSLDRIDVDGPYSPENCRWATAKEQADNRRDKRFIDTPQGKMKVEEASRIFGVSIPTLRSRIRYGWTDPEKMVSKPR